MKNKLNRVFIIDVRALIQILKISATSVLLYFLIGCNERNHSSTIKQSLKDRAVCETVFPPGKQTFIVPKGVFSTIVDAQGEVLLADTYTYVLNYSEGWAVGSRDGELIYIHDEGHVENNFHQFVAASCFCEGYAPVCQLPSRSWGYINREFKVVIKPMFSEAYLFSDGLALVKEDGAYGYIGREGKYEICNKYIDATPFSCGIAACRCASDGLWVYIDKKGEVAFPEKFIEAERFVQGFARVTRLSAIPNELDRFSIGPMDIARCKSSLIDVSGEVVLSNYSDGENGLHGLSKPILSISEFPRNSGDVMLWMHSGGHITYRSFSNSLDVAYSEGLVRFSMSGRWGFKNINGDVIIKPIYQKVKRFSEGLCAVCIDNKWGYINKSGKEVIQARSALYPQNKTGQMMSSRA